VELSPLPLPFSLCLSLFPVRSLWLPPSFPSLLFGPFLSVSLLPPFRSPSLPFRAFWLYRFFRATLRRQHPSRIPKEKESWVPGIENLNTYDPEGRFYVKCALSNDEKTRFLPSREPGSATKNYFLFPTPRNTCEINLSRREIMNNRDSLYELCFLVLLLSCLLMRRCCFSATLNPYDSDGISLVALI